MLLSMTFFFSLPFLQSLWLTNWFVLLVEKNFQCSPFYSAQKLKEFFKLVEWLFCPVHYALIKSKLESSPFPGVWIFEDWIIQILAPLGKMIFKCPTLIVGLSFVYQVPLLKNNHCLFLSSVIKFCIFMMRGDINSRWKAILDTSYTVWVKKDK